MPRLQANALLLLAALIWGSAFVGQAWGMDSMGPLTFTGLCFLLGAAVVAPLAWREWRSLVAAGNSPSGEHPKGIALLGSLLCAGVVMQQVGLMTTTVTNAGFLTALYAPLVPVLAWALEKRTPGRPTCFSFPSGGRAPHGGGLRGDLEKRTLGRPKRFSSPSGGWSPQGGGLGGDVQLQAPHWTVWSAAAGCLVGTWLLTGASPQSLQVGDSWLLASAAPWAVHVLLVGRAANRLRGAFVLACGQFLVCAVIALPLGLAIEPIDLDGLRRAAGVIAYTGVLSVGVGFTLQVVGQRHTRASDSAIVLSSKTVFAALFGAAFMGDRLGPTGLAACGLILLCIVLVQTVPALQPSLRP